MIRKILFMSLFFLMFMGVTHANIGWSNGTYNGNIVYTSLNGVSATQYTNLQTNVSNNQININTLLLNITTNKNDINNINNSIQNISNSIIEVTSVNDLITKLYQYNNTKKTFLFACEGTTYYNYSQTIILPLNLQHNIDGNDCAILNSTSSNAWIDFEGNNDNVVLRGFNMTGNYLVTNQLIQVASSPSSKNVKIMDVTVSQGNERLISYNDSITLRDVNILDSGGLVGSRSAVGSFDVYLDNVLITASAGHTNECFDENSHDATVRIFADNVRCEEGSTGHKWNSQAFDFNTAYVFASNLYAEMNESLETQAFRIGSEKLNFGFITDSIATGIGTGSIGLYLDGAQLLSTTSGITIIGARSGSECVRTRPQFGRGDSVVYGVQCINTTTGINGTGAHTSTRVHAGFNTFFNVTNKYLGDPHTFVFSSPQAEAQFKYVNSTTTRDSTGQNLVISYNFDNNSLSGSNIYDRSGFNNHGTEVNAQFEVNGGRDNGGAFFLDQTQSAYITTPYDASNDLTINGTFCMWVDPKPMGTGTYYYMARHWDKFTIEGREDRVRVRVYNSSGSSVVTSYETIATGEEYLYICGRKAGSTVSLLVNGIEERTTSIIGDMQSGSGALYVGRYGGGGYANITVSGVEIYNRALSDQEIYNNFLKSSKSPMACLPQKDVYSNPSGDLTINSLVNTYTGGSAYLCVYDNGSIYTDETAC